MGRNKNGWTGGPLNVGAFRNYPYWRAPRVWKDLGKALVAAFAIGFVVALWLSQKNPDLRELKSRPQPTVTVQVTETVEFAPNGPKR